MHSRIFRSFWSVVAGSAVGISLSLLTDFLLESIGIFPSRSEQLASGLWIWWMLLLALFYRCIYTASGGYIAAALAPGKPESHVMVLGMIALPSAIFGGRSRHG